MNSTAGSLKRIFDELDRFVRDNKISEIRTMEDALKYDDNKKKEKEYIQRTFSDDFEALDPPDSTRVRCALAALNGAIGSK